MAALPVELLDLSFLAAAECEASSGWVLMVFAGLAADEEVELSFLEAVTPSPGFFFTFSVFVLMTCVLTLARTFGAFSFLVLSAWVFDVVLVAGAAVPLEDVALGVVAPPEGRGLEEMGGVLALEESSSIGSSLTGVASPLSRDCSGSSPGFFFLIFLDFRTLVLDLATDEDKDGGLCGGPPLSSLLRLPLPWGE